MKRKKTYACVFDLNPAWYFITACTDIRISYYHLVSSHNHERESKTRTEFFCLVVRGQNFVILRWKLSYTWNNCEKASVVSSAVRMFFSNLSVTSTISIFYFAFCGALAIAYDKLAIHLVRQLGEAVGTNETNLPPNLTTK